VFVGRVFIRNDGLESRLLADDDVANIFGTGGDRRVMMMNDLV
jgi:hypothetical protein